MMNRIILIGNGFDLAHGLPTSYKDFIQGYWIFQRRRLLEDTSDPTDGLCCIKIDNPDDIKKLEHFSWILDNSMFRFQRGWQQQQQIEEYNNFFNSLPLKYESRFIICLSFRVVHNKDNYLSCCEQRAKMIFSYADPSSKIAAACDTPRSSPCLCRPQRLFGSCCPGVPGSLKFYSL